MSTEDPKNPITSKITGAIAEHAAATATFTWFSKDIKTAKIKDFQCGPEAVEMPSFTPKGPPPVEMPSFIPMGPPPVEMPSFTPNKSCEEGKIKLGLGNAGHYIITSQFAAGKRGSGVTIKNFMDEPGVTQTLPTFGPVPANPADNPVDISPKPSGEGKGPSL